MNDNEMDNITSINCWYCGAEQTDLVKRISELEAERSEVRNKVIEQAIDICKDYEVGWQVADIIEKLNSLKTK